MSTIAELFNKSPLELSRDDIDRIIQAYQEHMRLLRANGPKSVDSKTGEPKKRRRKAKPDPAQLDLDDLIKDTAK